MFPFNVAARKFKIPPMAGITLLLDSADLAVSTCRGVRGPPQYLLMTNLLGRPHRGPRAAISGGPWPGACAPLSAWGIRCDLWVFVGQVSFSAHP